LILKDNIDLMVVASTPETTNPVSDQCEANGIPCISTMAPWQPWFFGRNGDPATGFQWTYHFFWGLEDIIQVFVNLWDAQETNKVVGAMWPNDGDGNAWGDPKLGFPPALDAAGYTVIDPGRYENLKDDFSAEISLFKENNVEIVTGVMLPPDLGTFLTQAAQQGFNPKMFTVGKAALFPAVVQTIPDNLGDGLTTEIWWTPAHPFKSSLTGITGQQLADDYHAATQKQWAQSLGFIHALFEVAIDVLKRTPNLDDKAAIRDAIKATNLDTLVGPVSWEGGPVPNVTKTPLVGGQWIKGSAYPFELTVTDNKTAPNIPSTGAAKPMTWGK
jgi:branched-chain amino acid transport system substrate-binding protein